MRLFKVLTLVMLLLAGNSVMSQSHGITYQAVLVAETDQELPGIDVPGSIIPDRTIALRFTIQATGGSILYQETQSTSTDEYGMINVVIGEGQQSSANAFTEIDWNGEPMDLKVEIDLLEGDSYESFSDQPLYFVPYAFHRNITATGTMIIDGRTDLNDELNVNNGRPTNLSGDANVDGALDVDGASMLNSTLDVSSITTLGDDLNVSGITTLDSDLLVRNGSASSLSGNLLVEGETNLEGILSVNNSSASLLTGELTVEGITTISNDLNVTDQGNTALSGTLMVEGVADFLERVNFQSGFKLTADSASHMVVFENTNSGTGDGIKIKLGKQATKNNTGAETADDVFEAILGEQSALDKVDVLKRLLDNDPGNDPGAGILELAIPDLDPEELLEQGKAIVATACILATSVSNLLIDFLNDELGLPVTIDLGCVDLPLIPTFCLGTFDIVPEIPTIPTDFCTDVFGDGLSLGQFQLEDVYIVDPLSNENEFITFYDNTDWKMGTIRAQSIEDWARNYLSVVYFYDLYASFQGLDKTKIFAEVKFRAREVAASYLEIGVEYSSGNGDYAEWLERVNPKEIITAGDIVGIKGGKITKDLKGAEQVMAVSLKPIVLGNVPEEGKTHLGNMIAFMGQIPVKIMGEVKSGDFIIGGTEIAGYGFAIDPSNVTLDMYPKIVGRSWENNLTQGPKMVNTVVGLHNGDFIKIFKDYESKYKTLDARMNKMEALLGIDEKKNDANSINN